jgi:AraC-like DNA-binding protein
MMNSHSIEVNASNVVERFGLISSIISGLFRATYMARPLGADPRPASLTWAQADGVAFSHAEMAPLSLVHTGSRPTGSGLYYIYTADQPSRARLYDGSILHLQAGDFLVYDADMPLDWTMQRDYTTRSLLVAKELLHEYVPDGSPMIGRRLALGYGVGKVLSEIMDAAWTLTRAGQFEQAGPKLVRAFLGMLTMLPQQGAAVDPRASASTLEVRRLQVKAFIDKHFARSDLCVASIAKYLHLSPRYIQMAFASDDITPSEYLRARRLAASVALLEDPAKLRTSITEIALSCGFSSSAYFSTEFRRAYGMSPRQYRASRALTAEMSRRSPTPDCASQSAPILAS